MDKLTATLAIYIKWNTIATKYMLSTSSKLKPDNSMRLIKLFNLKRDSKIVM